MALSEWHLAFPEPRSSPKGISGEEVMKMFDDMDVSGEPKSFLLVDVRRNDWEVRSTPFLM